MAHEGVKAGVMPELAMVYQQEPELHGVSQKLLPLAQPLWEGRGRKGWAGDWAACIASQQCDLTRVLCSTFICQHPGRCLCGWAWFFLANNAPAQPAAHMAPPGSYQLPPHCVVGGNKQRSGEAFSALALALCDVHCPVVLWTNSGPAEPLFWEL